MATCINLVPFENLRSVELNILIAYDTHIVTNITMLQFSRLKLSTVNWDILAWWLFGSFV